MKSNYDNYENIEKVPENSCFHYWKCGNTIRGNSEMCNECLDEVRAKGKGYELTETNNNNE